MGNCIYFGEIERFGYNLQCAGNSEAEVRKAMAGEYAAAYKSRNGGCNPEKEYLKKQEGRLCDEEAADDYTTFLKELCIREMEPGHVEWS